MYAEEFIYFGNLNVHQHPSIWSKYPLEVYNHRESHLPNICLRDRYHLIYDSQNNFEYEILLIVLHFRLLSPHLLLTVGMIPLLLKMHPHLRSIFESLPDFIIQRFAQRTNPQKPSGLMLVYSVEQSWNRTENEKRVIDQAFWPRWLINNPVKIFFHRFKSITLIPDYKQQFLRFFKNHLLKTH